MGHCGDLQGMWWAEAFWLGTVKFGFLKALKDFGHFAPTDTCDKIFVNFSRARYRQKRSEAIHRKAESVR
ncbi:hypothetical protein QG37_03604 [Candidozyma auris]|nr:hypothetical protein QG37_03604 [[Candida] auris]